CAALAKGSAIMAMKNEYLANEEKFMISIYT
ncbi:MAG: hypothetical protein RLZZ557_138, partial [Bacteroidota bacterium]